MQIVAIVQARMGSKRLPGKVLKKIMGKPVIELLLTRLSRSNYITKVCVATSDNKADDILCSVLEELGYSYFRGSETDVLKRYYDTAVEFNADVIVRITGDCPLVEPDIVDTTVTHYLENQVDYVSNSNPPTFPDGLDVEVFSFESLKQANSLAVSTYDREHVTPFLRTGQFQVANVFCKTDLSQFRVTLDESPDLYLIREIFKAFSPDIFFSLEQTINFLGKNERLLNMNRGILRNEGATMTNGEKFYKRAKAVIAGGTSLLSKRPEMFLPNGWPAYFNKTKGIQIWDLDDREYLDMGLMGVGTNTLGYSHAEVDDAVRQVIDKGNLSSLNCIEEVLLAEKMLEFNKWASQVRFARTGGEANAIAVRLARAVAKNTGIAVCGYHGWHDWYLAANLDEKQNLDGHLMPGLDPLGVPRSLVGSVHTFTYNDFNALQELVLSGKVGIIKMEVMRNKPPKNNFLKKIRKLADDHKILLIFDECSSGFRQVFGGLFQQYDVEPDLAIFGKTLGNGYAITAVVGKDFVMSAAQETFISSTFWTERIGPSAALKTLEIMQREKSWDKITRTGLLYQEHLQMLADQIGLEITISGIPALTSYSVTRDKQAFAKTYITQELLKKGILATTAFYPSIAHQDKHLDYFFETLRPILEIIEKVDRTNETFDRYLDGPLSHTGFMRLN